MTQQYTKYKVIKAGVEVKNSTEDVIKIAIV